MPTMIDKVCEVCGTSFTVEKVRKRQKSCSKECAGKLRGAASSIRMKRRRNGGDPALNAKLAKACGDHLRRMWEKPEFREKHRLLGLAKMAAYMADIERRKVRDETNKQLMGNAARRLRKDADFLKLMSEKVKEYMAQEPYRPAQHGDYTPDYVSMIMHRVNTDAEVRSFCDGRMSLYLKEEQAIRRGAL